MKKITLFAIFCLLQGYIFAQKYSNEFLYIGVGGRGQAMGGAVTATQNDVMSAYWNPANLANLSASDGIQVGAMHTEWFAGIGNYDYVGVAIPTANKNRTVGLSVIRFGVDGIPNTLSLYNDDGTINYSKVTTFSAADYAVLGSFAQKSKNLAYGGNVKVIRRVIGTFANAWGFGFDVGANYKMGNFNIAANLRDASNTFNSWRFAFTDKEKQILSLTNNIVPISERELTKPSLTLGVGYQKTFNKISLATEVDMFATTDGERNTLISGKTISMSPAGGVEVGYDNLIFLRGGVSNFQKDNTFDKKSFWVAQPSVGLGLKIRNFNLDYAYTNVGSTELRSYSHIVSLLMKIKPREKEPFDK